MLFQPMFELIQAIFDTHFKGETLKYVYSSAQNKKTLDNFQGDVPETHNNNLLD